jgi:hypothetical protein
MIKGFTGEIIAECFLYGNCKQLLISELKNTDLPLQE